MNVKRPLNIALATSIALMSVGCNAQHPTGTPESLHTNNTQTTDGSIIRNEIDKQSRYEITFTKFFISQANDGELQKKDSWCSDYINYCERVRVPNDSEYLFYVYDPKTNAYKKKCFNDIIGCKNKVWVYAKPSDTVPLKVTISNVSDYVYLMVLEADNKRWNVLNQTPYTQKIDLATCDHQGRYPKTCLKIPVQYLYKNRYSCLKMATKSRNDEICLYYDIEKQQKLQSEFQSNLEKLSALSPLFKGENLVKFFKNDTSYNQEQEVKLFDFSRLPEVPNKSVLSVTFYANGRKASGLPTKIAQPVVDYLSRNYPGGLWVVNGTDGALAAYGADQLNEYPSSIRISVNWPQGISEESINKWLQTPKKEQVNVPYHTIKLVYRKGNLTVAKLMTKFNPMAYHENDRFDTFKTLPNTLMLPGRYTLGKHINKVEVELSGIFSLLKSQVDDTSIKLTPKYGKYKTQLDLPSGYQYKKNCQSISKTVPEWFETNTVMLQCPRLPKSLIEPDFDGQVRLNASRKELSLGLRFENQREQTSLKGWRIGNTTITRSGTQGYMLVNARDLPEPKNGQLTLVPPESAFSIFYLNEPITVELSEEQQDYLYTANSVPELNGSAAINLEVQNPKERPIETFKNSKNPWTPEELTFLCDGSQSNTTLCGKTCTIQKDGGLSCEGQQPNMSLKELKGYLISTRFLGKDWGIPSVQLESEKSLKNFFCGAWHLLFPVKDRVIVVGRKEHKGKIQEAQLRNTFLPNDPKQKQNIPFYTTTDNKPLWYGFLDSSGKWQLDSVNGRYDYYLHQASGCQSNGLPLILSIRPETVCNRPSSQQSRCQRSNIPSITGQQSYGNAGQIAQIDIVAVFAEKYNFQQQVVSSPISLNLGLDIPQTKQKELRAGWMRTWNKQATQSSLRDAIKNASQQRNPSVKLHYLYDDQNDREDKWLWSPMPGQAHLDNAPSITRRRDMAKVVNISDVVLENDILPVLRSLDDQVTKIIDHITRQWQPNGDYLLVILSDGISEQEMKQLNKNMLPRGNGKRQLLVLTSDFLPTDSQSVLSLPELPSNTGDTVISMYDKDWVENFVKAIFNF